MATTDLYTFLNESLDKLDFDGDIVVNWDKRHRTFTIELVFYAENKNQNMITDMMGVESTEPIVTFVDEILLYDKNKKATFNKEDYLACLSYDGKNGWGIAEARAFVSYLQIVLDNGESYLLDFLNDDDIDIFELVWSNGEFEKIVKSNEADVNSNDRIKYPRF